MASPFSIFRKYQKTLMVIAGVICMFVFVIGDSLMPYLSSSDSTQSGPSPNAVAVKWDGGSLTNRELENAKMRRALVNSFMRSVFYAGVEASQMAGLEPRSIAVEPIVGPETPEQGIERDIVRLKVFADAAREAGMSVSNENITRYLDELGRGYVSREDMRKMMAQMPGVSTDLMFDAIREEMLARNYLASYQYALETVTPEERWRDWKRVNDRVVVEAAAIPVDSFVVDVPDPTDEELLAFYDIYKVREPVPDIRGTMELPSPEPGFRVPRKYDLKYIVANYDKFLEKVESEVTDEEIQKYYDEKKDPLFIKADMGFMDELMGQPAEDEAPADDATSTEGETDAADTESAEEAEADENGAETESTEAPAESTGEPSAETPAVETETPAEQPADASPATEDSSLDSTSRPRVFRLAAFLQDADANSSEAATDSTDSSEATTTSGEAPADAPAETSTDSAPTGTAESTPPAGESATAESAESSATEKPDAEATDKPVEYQPLDEVKDQIRREIANERTAEQLVDLMKDIKDELGKEFNEYFGAVLNAEAQDKERPTPPPALVDLGAIAAKHGLEFGETGLKSILELRSMPVGESAEVDSDEPLLRLLFSDEMELYQPVLTRDLLANRYVVMKVEDVKGRIPKLDEIRDEVVRAWKLTKAAELAKKDAETKAKQAQEGGLPLSEFFAGNEQVEVVRTDPFAWLTGGAISRISGQQEPFRLSEPEGVVAAGPDFMEAVFDLDGNEIGSALNHDHSIAYVVRIADRQSTPEELHQDYLAEANTWDGLNIMSRSHGQTSAQVLLSEMLNSAEVEWERPFDQPLAEPAEEETEASDDVSDTDKTAASEE